MEVRLLTEPGFAEQFDIAVEDLTDAYVAGEIQGEDRQRAEAYFFKSPERQKKLKYAQALKAYKPERRSQTSWWTSPSVRIAASIVLMVGVAVGVWQISRPDDVDKGLVALHEAYRQERPFEARISGLQYAPTPASLRGEVKTDESQRKRAESLLEIALQDQRNAKSLHARGQAYLAARQFDEAIRSFEDALKLSNDAETHSDLGVALLEKGKRSDANQGKGVESFAGALEHLTRALELDSSLLEALFNRALTYKYLGLPDKAEQDWRLYLDKDPSSQWSNEAREQLKSVEQMRQRTSQTRGQIYDEFVKHIDAGERGPAWKIVRDSESRTGNVVVNQLLDNYLERGTDTELNRLASIAEMDRVKNSDHFYEDVLAFYRSADPRQRDSVKQARELMAKSHAGWGRDYDESLKLFSDAKKLFEEAGDIPEAKLAEYWMALSHYFRSDENKYENSLKIVEPLLAACDRNRYVWLKVRGLYVRSSNEFALSKHSDALSSSQEAAKLAETTEDNVGLLNVVSALVYYYRYLGNYQKSFAQIQKALPLITSITVDPVTLSRHYGFAAMAFAAMGFYDAALNYQESALRLSPRVQGMAYQHAFLAAINGKRRHFEDALRNVSTGFEIAKSTPSLMAFLALERGHIYREMGDCNNAVSSYSQSIDLYNSLNFEAYIYHAHKGRFLCYLAQKDDARAQYEIQTTLHLMENYRKEIKEENNRNTFFEIEQSVYDQAMDFEATRMNNPDGAFKYLQDSQARTLLDLMSTPDKKSAGDQDLENFISSVTQPESVTTIKDKLPDNAQLVQYAVLDDKILIWVISRHADVAFKSVSVSRSELNETIDRYLQVISKPSTGGQDGESLAKKLYSILVQPVASLLDPNKIICIIPDKRLSYLPFTALVSDSGRYLTEQYVLTTSQSPSVFLQCSKHAAEKAQVKEETVLSVGNPAFDKAAFSELNELPNAGEEAREVAKLYKHPLPLLLEGNATESEVRKQMIKSDVAHLAMHSVVDEVPSNSKLLLAKGDNLHAHEIYKLTLPRTRLLVLSSCQSGAERYYDGEGMASLARAFLAARVPLVVASLWPVDSVATEKLMVSFHRQRAQGSTAEALAKAQREMLRDPDNRFRSPFYWAGFALNGGYAQF